MPRDKSPPLTLKPTATGSVLPGKVAVPNAALASSTLRVAPLPMKSWASLISKASKSPRSVFTTPLSVTVTPLTVLRLTFKVALPRTTSAMLSPMDPPMRNSGSVGLSPTLLPVSNGCVQSKTAPPTEAEFN